MSPWGPVWGHDHRFRLINVENGDKAVIPLRDPISRFVSGFYSRLRKGEPRYYREWREEERTAFEWFSTPRELADALAQPAGEARRRAEFAMQVDQAPEASDDALGRQAALLADEPRQGPVHGQAGDPGRRLGAAEGAARAPRPAVPTRGRLRRPPYLVSGRADTQRDRRSRPARAVCKGLRAARHRRRAARGPRSARQGTRPVGGARPPSASRHATGWWSSRRWPGS